VLERIWKHWNQEALLVGAASVERGGGTSVSLAQSSHGSRFHLYVQTPRSWMQASNEILTQMLTGTPSTVDKRWEELKHPHGDEMCPNNKISSHKEAEVPMRVAAGVDLKTQWR
jgi:hypothetical protein